MSHGLVIKLRRQRKLNADGINVYAIRQMINDVPNPELSVLEAIDKMRQHNCKIGIQQFSQLVEQNPGIGYWSLVDLYFYL